MKFSKTALLLMILMINTLACLPAEADDARELSARAARTGELIRAKAKQLASNKTPWSTNKPESWPAPLYEGKDCQYLNSDITVDNSSRFIAIQTPDSIESVTKWYESALSGAGFKRIDNSSLKAPQDVQILRAASATATAAVVVSQVQAKTFIQITVQQITSQSPNRAKQ